MVRRGFTLLEILISISLTLILLSASFSIFSSALIMNKNIIAEKELIEIGNFLQKVLTKEFSRADRIESILDKENSIHTNIGGTLIDIRAIKLIRSKRVNYRNSYKEQLIYLKDYGNDLRRSMWSYKNSSIYRKININLYSTYRAYEIGTQVKSLRIKQIQNNIYYIELILKYYDMDIVHQKSFLVKLQD